MRAGKRNRLNPCLDIAPLIDCVFLLLIFFVLTSSLVEQAGFKIDLPGAAFSSRLDDRNINIYVNVNGDLYADGRRIGPGGLQRLLAAAGKPVVIRADKNVRFEVITGIMDIAGSCNVDKLSIATVRSEK